MILLLEIKPFLVIGFDIAERIFGLYKAPKSSSYELYEKIAASEVLFLKKIDRGTFSHNLIQKINSIREILVKECETDICEIIASCGSITRYSHSIEILLGISGKKLEKFLTFRKNNKISKFSDFSSMLRENIVLEKLGERLTFEITNSSIKSFLLN